MCSAQPQSFHLDTLRLSRARPRVPGCLAFRSGARSAIDGAASEDPLGLTCLLQTRWLRDLALLSFRARREPGEESPMRVTRIQRRK